jgi:hypothetical protein
MTIILHPCVVLKTCLLIWTPFLKKMLKFFPIECDNRSSVNSASSELVLSRTDIYYSRRAKVKTLLLGHVAIVKRRSRFSLQQCFPSPVDFSVARWRFSPPDLQNSAGFESRLAGKKYFWRTPNFWRISGGFDQFCMVCFCLADSGGFEVSISKKTTCFSLFLA